MKVKRFVGCELVYLLITLVSPLAFANKDCSALSSLNIDNGVITSVEWIDPTLQLPKSLSQRIGKFNFLDYSFIDLSRAFCRVSATLQPTDQSNIKVELWLPEKRFWNKRLLGTGNGGPGGSIEYWALAGGLDLGYATVQTDMGTSNPTDEITNFDFGIRAPEWIADWAYRSTHLMTGLAKQMIIQFYQEPAKFSYFIGCSTGGHQALAEAQKYPSDYDGIIASAPGIHRVEIHARALWMSNINRQKAEGTLSKQSLQLLERSAIKQCDGIDGILDGVIDDPRRCHVRLQSLLCEGQGVDGQCLQREQLQTIKRLYAGVRDPDSGELLLSGITPGSESGLASWINHPFWGERGGLLAWAEYSDWDNHKSDAFDPVNDFKTIYTKLSPRVDFTDANVLPFKNLGGKLILTNGWADSLTPAQRTIDYYESLEASIGDRKATQDFARLFLVPGMRHCGGGPGPNQLNLLTPLKNWVERGIAPEKIIAAKSDDNQPKGKLVRSRPICPYPQVAQWLGRGDKNTAASFHCVERE